MVSLTRVMITSLHGWFYDCQYDENGTLLDSECIESVVFYFNGSNGSGTYSYQVEKMVNDSYKFLDKHNFRWAG